MQKNGVVSGSSYSEKMFSEGAEGRWQCRTWKYRM